MATETQRLAVHESMMRLTLVSILLVGCSNTVEPADLAPQGDAAADVGEVPTSDATVDGADSTPPDADGGLKVETGAPRSDAGPEASIDVVGVDVALADRGSLDAPSSVDAPLDVADAGARTDADAGNPPADADAASQPVDAAPVDARTDATLPCTASTATCDSVNRTEAAIRATFTQPCTTDARQCGGLVEGGIVNTVPMICKAGAWSLAWCLNAACYGCSMQCPANQLCNP